MADEPHKIMDDICVKISILGFVAFRIILAFDIVQRLSQSSVCRSVAFVVVQRFSQSSVCGSLAFVVVSRFSQSSVCGSLAFVVVQRLSLLWFVFPAFDVLGFGFPEFDVLVLTFVASSVCRIQCLSHLAFDLSMIGYSTTKIYIP